MKRKFTKMFIYKPGNKDNTKYIWEEGSTLFTMHHEESESSFTANISEIDEMIECLQEIKRLSSKTKNELKEGPYKKSEHYVAQLKNSFWGVWASLQDIDTGKEPLLVLPTLADAKVEAARLYKLAVADKTLGPVSEPVMYGNHWIARMKDGNWGIWLYLQDIGLGSEPLYIRSTREAAQVVAETLLIKNGHSVTIEDFEVSNEKA